MTPETMKYALVIEKGEDGFLWGFFPDLPGCTTAGETLDDIVGNAGEALDLYFEDETALPPARSIAEILADPDIAADIEASHVVGYVAIEHRLHHEPVAAL